ncbi:hypothetical protein LGQ03_08075 [Loktanella sp. TSTF-M6]|uniref:HEPN domain-containing protein n=1 Tax=Loktanella gaetbuli TaxID=2881335 RepID=A0ABS8BTY5_9RHOB|nr:hypothetical protein [Loktanella gaetbuli]MCB5199195.1 hypothetical protein [Loktanella gaetbuli]
MDTIAQNLSNWRASLMKSIPVAGLIAREPDVYKWKAPFRCWLLREAAFWRATDLLTQSYELHQQGHGLGARILLRSGFETLATLIYLNQLMQKVAASELDFHEFGKKTSILLLGSRDGSTQHQSLNIVTILQKCDKRYPGLEKLYGILSESSHPNYEGLLAGYSKFDHDEYETFFSNRWMETYGGSYLGSIELCMATFQREYDDVWTSLMENLENWIVENDDRLEATKNTAA